MKTMPAHEAELACDARAILGEGPLWSAREGVLYWVDIVRGEVHRFDPATGRDARVALGASVGTVVERARGGLAVATDNGFAGLDFATGTLEPWCHPEAHKPTNRFNDGKVDPHGRFWAGTMAKVEDEKARGVGTLYCLRPDRSVAQLAEGITVSNGLAWSADGTTCYYIDSPTAQVWAYRYDAHTPTLRDRRVVVQLDGQRDGWPDGMCIDAEGMLWVAHWGGWCVNRWDPKDGRKLATIKVPVACVTSCCFGGAKHDELWITTASRDLDAAGHAKQPHAGGVFRAKVGVAGPASTLFAG